MACETPQQQYRAICQNLGKLYKNRDFVQVLIAQHEAELKRLGKFLDISYNLEEVLQHG